MQLILQSPKQKLKAFLKHRPSESERDLFKANLKELLDKITVIDKMPKEESEEHLKNLISRFLLNTYYEKTNEVNTKDKKDLVIYENKLPDSDVLVIIEAKRPSNTDEMIFEEKPNRKAIQELILYYLNERKAGNFKLKNLVVTNIHKWFIIDAKWFDKYFYSKRIQELYETKVKDKKPTPFFYEEVAKLVDQIEEGIPCVYFDITKYESILRNSTTDDDKELIALYKILSPQHLLKITTPNDSNTLNERFYKELLHIIGLEEAKVGTKNVIRRKIENRNCASLIELTIEALTTEDIFHRITDIKIYGENKEEQTFNIALELCITWINRILFLKLLEGQLISYHQGDKDYRFLNSETIHDYDELFKLFHKVLAVNIADRTEAIKSKYKRIPYLNSSLFEISDLEDQTIKINSLENNGALELINTTILKDIKKNTASLPSLDYLFQFLDAYDFASEGTEDWQKDNKQLINASVLGKVFEKINGYRDGSIFTPAFITMYMCRQSIRLAVLDKFNNALSENGKNLFDRFEDIKNYTLRHYKTEDILKANEIINSLHICDPAVGSGHFLVSALNEIIAIKAELGILADEKGNALSNYEIEVINDELDIRDRNNNKIEYKLDNGKPISKEVQRLQKALFYQKQTIIENCLFGVDINPKSVLICRLRLWIELLKNAYYKEDNFNELETLPNIDINIKCGNSLISRFALDADITKALKSIKYDIKEYRGFVNDYKNEKKRDAKRGLQKIIDSIKSDFKTEIIKTDKDFQNWYKAKGDYEKLTQQSSFFELTPKEKKKWSEDVKVATEKMKKYETVLDEIRSSVIYKNAFEWRFEFPEVLNNRGEFEGFDLILGNPPYGAEIQNREILRELFSKTSVGQIDTYKYFIELCLKISKQNGIATYITSDSYLEKKYFADVRKIISDNSSTIRNIKLGDDIFEGVNLPTAIFQIQKGNPVISYEYKDISDIKGNVEKTNYLTNDLEFDRNFPEFQTSFSTKKSIIQNINCIKLIDIYDQVMGVKVYQIGKGKPKQTSYEIENNTFISDKKINSNYYNFISQGIERYNYKSKGEWINYGDWLAEPRQIKYFKNPKIIVREIVNPRIFATYIEEEAVVKNIAAVIIEKENNFSLKYLLALMNSKLFSYYLFEQTPKGSNKSYPSFTSDLIKNIPIKNISLKEQKPFIDLVDKIISLKILGENINAEDKYIDKLVYELYGITSEDQELIEQKIQ